MRGIRTTVAVVLALLAAAAAFETVSLALGYPPLMSSALRHRWELLTTVSAGVALTLAWLSRPRRRTSTRV